MPGRTQNTNPEGARPVELPRPKSSPNNTEAEEKTLPTGAMYLAAVEGETTTEGHLGKIDLTIALTLDAMKAGTRKALEGHKKTHERLVDIQNEATEAKTAAKAALLAGRLHEQHNQQRHQQVMQRFGADARERAEERTALLNDIVRLTRQGSLHDAQLTLVRKKLSGREIATYVASVGVSVGIIVAVLRLLGIH
jgi:hypothetical protein